MKMKSISVILFCLSTLLYSQEITVCQSEVKINLVGTNYADVSLYHYDANTNIATLKYSGSISGSSGEFDVANVPEHNISGYIDYPIFGPVDYYEAKNIGYYLVVNNVYTFWQYANLDVLFTYDESTHSLSGSTSRWEHGIAISLNFDGGHLVFDGNTVSSVNGTFYGPSFPHTVSVASVQTASNGTTMFWNKWNNDNTSTSIVLLGTIDDIHLVAIYNYTVCLTFSGSKVSITKGGVTTTVNENEPYLALTGQQITITAVPNPGITYNSVSWSTGGTGSTISYYPSGPANITVSATKTANLSYRGLDFKDPNGTSGPTAGQYVTLKWNKYDDPDITGYDIYRTIKDVQSNTLIASIEDRNTTMFTDFDCRYTSGYTNNLISYDVIAVMQSPNTSSGSQLVPVYGIFDVNPNVGENKEKQLVMSTIPNDYDLGAYPNPFNPSTIIKYSIPKSDFVSLKVYNLLSQEVASLVEETKAAGTHTVKFNANNLPSGIYIARLQTGYKVISFKLQLVK